MAQDVLGYLRRLNRGVAYVIGAVLLITVLFVLSDILLRQVGASFGGTDEISGYVMAVTAAWGMGFAMLELGHVRIDLMRSRLMPLGRVLLDLVAMSALAVTVTLVALRCWPVLEKSIVNGSHANTVLETPLWLVQGPWFVGWIWFAVMAWLTLLAALALVAQGRFSETEGAIGAFAEQDALL